MPEAVIVATGRTPIGRAFKGSLVDMRPDDLTALVVREVLAKFPELDPHERRGPASWAAASRPASRASTSRASPRSSPGSTTSPASRSTGTARRRSRPSAWPPTRSAPARATSSSPPGSRPSRASRNGASDQRQGDQPPLRRRRWRAPSRAPSASATRGRPPEGLPDIYIAMGQTAENVAECEKRLAHSRWTSSRCAARSWPWSPGERLLRARDHPGHPARRHGGVERRRPAAGHDAREALLAGPGLPRGRHGHGRQRLPAQRRRRGGRRDERHQGARSSASPRSRASSPVGRQRAQPRDHGPRPDRGVAARRWRAPA